MVFDPPGRLPDYPRGVCMARIQEYAEVTRVDYKGRTYSNFYPRRNHTGPGYVVYGHSEGGEYGGKLISRCAVLVKRYANGRTVHTGWRREWDAYQFALYLNGTDAGTMV
jgi:hypothetical protein